MNNNYQLSGRIHTTGWNPSFDVNSTNDYGMTPTEVAMQAGNLSEFVQITSHPDFKLANMGRVGLFMNICRTNSESNYTKMKQFFDANFKFDTSARAYVRLA
jgi:hypothetical protein